MKAFLVVFRLVILVVAIKAEYNSGGGEEGEERNEEEQGLSCEAKEGCCKDSLDCPGCCNPPYDNQCSNLKGVHFNFCEITGTWFVTGISLNLKIFSPYVCPSINIAGNYPGQCQGSLYINYKENKTIAGSTQLRYESQPTYQADIVRFASCGHVVINGALSSQYAEPFLINVVALKKNEAGLAIVACYAIYKAPAFFSYIISPTPNPNPWAYGELKEALEPYYGYSANPTFQSFNYTGCYPTLPK